MLNARKILLGLVLITNLGCNAEQSSYRDLAKFLGVAVGTTVVLAGRRAWSTGKQVAIRDEKVLDPGTKTSKEMQKQYFFDLKNQANLTLKYGVRHFSGLVRALFGR